MKKFSQWLQEDSANLLNTNFGALHKVANNKDATKEQLGISLDYAKKLPQDDMNTKMLVDKIKAHPNYSK